jgi:SAM-dependent methyltransferase
MYKKLHKYLKRPALYERTTEKFWTDPHIANQMLEAHLDPNTDAASFKPEFIDRSVEWILSLPLPENARLLDIGCGPGLYTKRFAGRGLCVTGLDFSENSINYARGRDALSEYIIGDYLEMEFDGVFDIVTLIQCDYGALIPDERRNLLRRVFRALKPGGLFLFDVFTPLTGKGKHDYTRWEVNPNGGFMSPNPHICLYADYYYGETAAGSRTVMIDEQGVRCWNLWDCYFTKQSLTDEVTLVGFYEVGFYNDVAGSLYTDDTQRMCVVLKKG